MTQAYIFRGDYRYRPATSHPDALSRPEPYVAARKLIRAVNLAIYLQRPLLLEGEAGCGKTRLARAVAYELGLPFYPWHVRSATRSDEGFYTYDAILRLHDAQIVRSGFMPSMEPSWSPEQRSAHRDPADPDNYLQFGPLGKAFTLTDRPAVVLIDEIDKADLDFPNDLLAVLDDPWTFTIPETGKALTAMHRPIVIITSNKEKGNLPLPFLRRCIYFYVEFPDKNRLKEIVAAHYQLGDAPSPPPDDLVDRAIDRFLAVRADASLHKKPGTSEFLDWLEALRGFTGQPDTAADLKAQGVIPYPELLFKLRADWQQML